jgi:Ca-activated chloride channel family protein
MKNLRILLYTLLSIFFLYACAGSGDSAKETGSASTTDEYYTTEEAPLAEESEMMSKDQASERKAKESAPIDHRGDTTRTENTEEYEEIKENPFVAAQQSPVTTFSIDVDNASYSNVRRFIQSSQMPPANAVRIEEMVNYFSYNYPNPTSKHPFSITTEVAECPWNPSHQLVHIGLQGKKLDYKELNPCNLVFLVDASGSMSDANKLPLLKKSLALLLDQLGDKDRIAIVAYAGAAGLVLPSTPAKQKSKILSALNSLESGGSTAGGEGIELAYKIAKDNIIKGGNNRVILATDGDFNVGTSGDEALVKLIEEKRKDDIYLTICGFGMGNYKDGKMEKISNAGNGNYFYIDNVQESKKVFVTEMRANLFTIAKDVKIQIEFNPQKVKGYRLLGYENRRLNNEDFDDDTKDAGELGAGHSVTAVYEIIPVGSASIQMVSNTNEFKFESADFRKSTFASNELMNVRLRYKPIKSSTSVLLEQKLTDNPQKFTASSEDFRFSAAVTGFGLLLRNSQYKGKANYAQIVKMAKSALGKDPEGHRAEFVRLVEQAALLK